MVEIRYTLFRAALIALCSSWAHPPPLPLVAPGVGLSRGPLRSRAAHPAGATLDDTSGPTMLKPLPRPALTIPCAFLRQRQPPGRASYLSGQPARPDSPAITPEIHPQPQVAVPQKSTAPRFRSNRTGQLPEGQPTTPRYLPSAADRKRPPATSTPTCHCYRVGGRRAAGQKKAGPRRPLVAADTEDAPPPQAQPAIPLLRR